jgi:hypothetical protein
MVGKKCKEIEMNRLTEEECVERGGHFWREWQGNDTVDENFNKRPFSTLLNFIGPEPKHRGCPICGRREDLVRGYWKDVNEPSIRMQFDKAIKYVEAARQKADDEGEVEERRVYKEWLEWLRKVYDTEWPKPKPPLCATIADVLLTATAKEEERPFGLSRQDIADYVKHSEEQYQKYGDFE